MAMLIKPGPEKYPFGDKPVALCDLPPEERLKYLDEFQDPNHPSVTQTDFTCRCDDTRKAKEKLIKDQSDTIAQQQTNIQTLTAHVTTLTNTLNSLLAKYPL